MTAFGWALADSWTIARRTLVHWRMQPGLVIFNWFFPVLMLLMFGALLGGAMDFPEGQSYYELLVPGIFALAMLFGLEGTMTAVTQDKDKGVTDRFRSLPMSSAAVVLGRCIADMLDSAVTLIVLVAGRARARLAVPRRAAGGAGGVRVAAVAAVRVAVGGDLHRADGEERAERDDGAGARLADRLPVQRLRRHLHDAGLARNHRPVEPALRHRDRVPSALR